MVAKVLNTVSIVGESRKGKPNKFIIAAFNEKMILYIPYNVKAPYNNIIIAILLQLQMKQMLWQL